MSMTASTDRTSCVSARSPERLHHAGVTSSPSTRRSMRPGALPPLKPPGVCDCVCVGVGQSLIDDGVSAGRVMEMTRSAGVSAAVDTPSSISSAAASRQDTPPGCAARAGRRPRRGACRSRGGGGRSRPRARTRPRPRPRRAPTRPAPEAQGGLGAAAAAAARPRGASRAGAASVARRRGVGGTGRRGVGGRRRRRRDGGTRRRGVARRGRQGKHRARIDAARRRRREAASSCAGRSGAAAGRGAGQARTLAGRRLHAHEAAVDDGKPAHAGLKSGARPAKAPRSRCAAFRPPAARAAAAWSRSCSSARADAASARREPEAGRRRRCRGSARPAPVLVERGRRPRARPSAESRERVRERGGAGDRRPPSGSSPSSSSSGGGVDAVPRRVRARPLGIVLDLTARRPRLDACRGRRARDSTTIGLAFFVLRVWPTPPAGLVPASATATNAPDGRRPRGTIPSTLAYCARCVVEKKYVNTRAPGLGDYAARDALERVLAIAPRPRWPSRVEPSA